MKIYNYVLLSITLMVVLSYLGQGFTGNSWVFTKMGLTNLANVQQSTFFIALGTMFAIGIAGAFIGTFFAVTPTFAIKGAYIMTTLGGLILDYVLILTQPNTPAWIQGILSLIFLPLIGGYMIALSEFWDGRD